MSHSPLRAHAAAAVLTLLCGLTGALLVSITFGFSVEYADTGAGALAVATSTLADWAMFLVVPGAFAVGALAVARRDTRLRVTAIQAVVLALTTAGIAVSGVVGAAAKYERYPSVPNCTDGFTGGPAHHVVHAAQDAYDELDHPGPFSGGGSTGIDGCESQLMVRGDVDPAAAYRTELADFGWRIDDGPTDGALRAVRGDQAFELTRGDHDDWWVWIGPRDLSRRQLDEGQVGLRTP
jgi:hypothetical protein